MKIAISAVGIDNHAGTGRHVAQLIGHLIKIDHDNEYLIFLSRKQKEDIRVERNANNFRWFIIPEIMHNVFLGTILNITYIYYKLVSEKVDLVHFLEMNRCYIPRFCHILVTVHGLIAIQVNNKDGMLRSFYHKKGEPFALKRANHIIAVSNNTKMDIIKFVHIPEKKISIIPNGCIDWPEGSVNFERSTNPNIRKIQNPYILFVSRIEHPNKNHVGLLHAFRTMLNKKKQSIQLVFVGEEGWRAEVVKKTINDLDLNNYVILTGFVSDLELKTLYSKARALIMPSLYEGFGIPVIEAMSMGIPVACSDTSSLKEIAQDAAVVFDPEKNEEIVEALIKVLWDEKTREKLKEKGLKRASEFTWPEIANNTVELYKSISGFQKKGDLPPFIVPPVKSR